MNARSLLALALLAAPAPAQSNDCSSAMPIDGLGSFPFTTQGLTGGGGTPASCNFAPGPDGYFAWTPPADGSYILATCGSSYDAILTLSGSCSGVELACSSGLVDGIGTCTGTIFDAAIVVHGLNLGSTYIVQVSGLLGSTGTGTLEIFSTPSPPVHDECDGALPAQVGVNPFDMTSTTDSGQPSPCSFNVRSDLWYEFVPTATGAYRFVIPAGMGVSDQDVLTVWDQCGGTVLGCHRGGLFDVVVPVANLQAGNPYLVQVDGAGSLFGTGHFEIQPFVPPVEDDCATPRLLLPGAGSFAFDTSLCTTGAAGQNETRCITNTNQDALAYDAWFRWTATLDGVAVLDLCPSQGNLNDPRLAIYPGTGCPADGTAVGCGDDACLSKPQVAFPVLAGQDYSFQVGSHPTTLGGSGTVQISEYPPSPPGCLGDWSFENFDDSWTLQDLEDPSYALLPRLDGAQPLLSFFGSFATEGRFALVHGWNGSAGVISASQDKFIELGEERLLFDYRAAWNTSSFVTEERRFQLVVRDASGATLHTEVILVAAPGTSNNDTGPLTGTVDLAAFAGQTVNLAFEWTVPQSNMGSGMFQLDNLRCAGAPVGTSYCISVANSSGVQARMGGTGSASVAANDFSLVATGLPVLQPGLFYYGPDQMLAPFGNGFRCVGPGASGLTLLPVSRANDAGTLFQTVDLTLAGSGQLAAGSTWNFQAWFRDLQGGGAFFSLSDALNVTFQP